MKALKLAADTKDAALAVGIAGAVRQKAVVNRRPDAYRLANAARHLCRNFLVAKVAVNDEHRVYLFGVEAVDHLLRILIAVHDIDRVDSFQVYETHLIVGKMLSNIGNHPMTAFFRFFPVEDAGARRYVASHGCQADFDIVLKHCASFFHLYCPGTQS